MTTDGKSGNRASDAEIARSRRRLFNEIAGRYELLNTLMSAGRHRAWRNRALRELAPAAGEKALDLCGGTGDFSKLFREKAGIALDDLVVADISEGMLRKGSPRFPGRGVQADACALPLRGASFDVVVNGFGMRNLPDAQLGAREVLRVLKPGGRVLFLDFFRPDAAFTKFFYYGIGAAIIRLAGLLFRRNDHYAHLLRSLRGFLTTGEFEAMLAGVGFAETKVVPLDFGVAHAVFARRPAE